MTTLKMQFANRLRQALMDAGYDPKPSVVEREFNLRCWSKPVTLHGARRWLKGETMPTEEKMVILAEWLNVSPRYLRFGDHIELRIEEKRSFFEQMAYQEREVLEAYLLLPLQKRQVVREVILAFAAHNKLASSMPDDE